MYAENSDLELIPANKEGSLISQEPALARTVASFNASHIPPASLDRRDRPCVLKACGACFDVVGWVLQLDFSLLRRRPPTRPAWRSIPPTLAFSHVKRSTSGRRLGVKLKPFRARGVQKGATRRKKKAFLFHFRQCSVATDWGCRRCLC